MRADDARHGTRAGYYAHRADGEGACGPCKRAAAAAEQRYVLARIRNQPGRIPATGTKRRLRALQALGWTLTELAAQMGTERSRVEKWCTEDKQYVYATTAARVAELYERLCMTVPTSSKWTTRTRNLARKRGYLPPLAWDDIDRDPEPPMDPSCDDIDPVVVQRILAGDVVPSTNAERSEVARRWARDGRSLNDLERLTGWKIHRYWKQGAA